MPGYGAGAYGKLMGMKRYVIFILIALALTSSAAFAAELEPAGTPWRKLQRGFANIGAAPIFEISNEMARHKKEDAFPPTWFTGFGRGALYGVGRVMAGAYEVVTFPLPLPSGYGPVVEPEFSWQHAPAIKEEVKKK